MKIEVGDKVRMHSGKVGIVEKIFENGMMLVRTHATQSIMTSTYQVQEVIGKGEKKMEYRGIEAYKALQEGKTLELGAVSKSLYKMMGDKGDTIYTKRKNEDAWSYCDMELNFFMSRLFIEYKEPLKYKVGDEVWVKAKVIQIDEVNNNLPYQLDLGEDCTAWFEENEVKGIDE